ncbi:hypothetical protein L0152_02770 [bacterium]|nr:hypothetical protein [bacterium]
MISKIQGSTQMPTQVQQQETGAAETKKKTSDMNGPMAGSNDQPRTAPPVQPRNPAAERKYEAHLMAADLNAKFNSIHNGQPKPPETNGTEMEDLMVSHVKDPDKTPDSEGKSEPNPPDGNAIKALQFMVDGIKSDPPKTPEGTENKFTVWAEDTKL